MEISEELIKKLSACNSLEDFAALLKEAGKSFDLDDIKKLYEQLKGVQELNPDELRKITGGLSLTSSDVVGFK